MSTITTTDRIIARIARVLRAHAADLKKGSDEMARTVRAVASLADGSTVKGSDGDKLVIDGATLRGAAQAACDFQRHAEQAREKARNAARNALDSAEAMRSAALAARDAKAWRDVETVATWYQSLSRSERKAMSAAAA